MSQTISFGRLLDIRIGIHFSWIALYALVTWSISQEIAGVSRLAAIGVGAICAALLFASVVAHELGHALCAKAHGVRTRSITLFLFGGVALLETDPPSPRAEVAIALAGPATSAVLAGIAYACALACGAAGGFWADDLAPIVTYVALANGVLAVFNLLPAFPMDGGRVLRAALWRMQASYGRATAASAAVGIGFAVVLASIGVVMVLSTHVWEYAWYVVLGGFLARNGWEQYRAARTLVRVDDRRARAAESLRATTPPAAVPSGAPAFAQIPLVENADGLAALGHEPGYRFAGRTA